MDTASQKVTVSMVYCVCALWLLASEKAAFKKTDTSNDVLFILSRHT